MKKTFLVSLLLIFVVLIINDLASEEKGEQGQPYAPKYGGTFKSAIESNIKSLDPIEINDVFSFHAASQIYEGLLDFQDKKPVPMLAKSWESKDNKTWIIHLRKDVFFQDDKCFSEGKGRLVTAQDVKYSFERLVDPNLKSAGAWLFKDIVVGAALFFNGEAKEVTGFKIKDDFTLQIDLTNPYPPFLFRLSTNFCFIVPREAVEKYGKNFSFHPVGTGPFKLASYAPDREIRLARNLRYWGRDSKDKKLPYLDEVNIRIIRDDMIRFANFKKGNLNVTKIPLALYPQIVTKEKKLSKSYNKYKLILLPGLEVQYYGFVLNKQPLGKNKALRQAINFAINKKEILKYILKGKGYIAKGFIAPGFSAYNAELEGYAYDLEKAKQKLVEAGYPKGKGLPEIEILLNAGTEIEAIATTIQNQLNKVGIHCKLSVTDFQTLIGKAFKGDAQVFRMWVEPLYPESEILMVQFLTKNVAPSGWNLYRYSNSKVDRFFEEAMLSRSQKERIEKYKKIEEIVVEDAPWIFLFFGEISRLLEPHVQGYVLDELQHVKYKSVWLKQ